MQIKVKIISCSDALFWYNQYIDEIFDVIKTEEDIYWVREPSGYKNFILRKDAEVWKLN